MLRQHRRPGAGLLAVFAASVIGSTWLVTAPAQGVDASQKHVVPLEQASFFPCAGTTGTSGFGQVKYIQEGSKLTVKFDLQNAPAHDTLHIAVGQCQSSGSTPVMTDLGTVTTDGKGKAGGIVHDTLQPGMTSYFLCLDDGTNDFGTNPVPVA